MRWWALLPYLARPGPARGGAPNAGERILISLVDGAVVTLDAWSGDFVGSFASGGPLVSSSSAHTAEGQHAIVPGLDGSIYELRDDGHIDMLRYSAAEIAALEAPAMQCFEEFVDGAHAVGDGAAAAAGGAATALRCGLLVGERTRTIIAVDVESGGVRWVQPDDGGNGARMVDEAERRLARPTPFSSERPPALLQREQYIVRAMDAADGAERWNITVGSISAFGVVNSPPPAAVLLRVDGESTASSAAAARGVGAAFPRLQWQGERVLAAFGGDGRALWSVTLETAPTALFGATALGWWELDVAERLDHDDVGALARLRRPLLLDHDGRHGEAPSDRLIAPPTGGAAVAGARWPPTEARFETRSPHSLALAHDDGDGLRFETRRPHTLALANKTVTKWVLPFAAVVLCVVAALLRRLRVSHGLRRTRSWMPLTPTPSAAMDRPVSAADLPSLSLSGGVHDDGEVPVRAASAPALGAVREATSDGSSSDESSDDDERRRAEAKRSRRKQQPRAAPSSPAAPDATTAPGPPLVSRQRYSLEFEERSALGDGGFGTVTLSVNRLDGTEYAIKKIRLSSAIRWRPRLDKMLREVKILALLDHPNIVRYYQAWLEECAAPDPAQGGESSSGEATRGDTTSGFSALTARPGARGGGSRAGLAAGRPAPIKSDVLDCDAWSESETASLASWTSQRGGRATSPKHLVGRWWNHSSRNSLADAAEQSVDGGDDDASATQPARAGARPPPAARRSNSDLAGADFGGEAGAAAVSVRPRRARVTYDLVLHIQMQYCASKTLSEYLGARPAQSLGEVDLETARRIFVQIARGLRYVHSCGLVHRDLKPANIFLTAEGTVKIGDFGLSRYAAEAHADGDAAAAAATHLEALGGGGGDLSVGVGTRAYAAPEQLSSDDYGQQADIFSLGLVLFEMVHPKFATAMERAVVFADLHARKLPDTKAWPQRDDDVAELINSMLAPTPTERPSAAEALTVVERMLDRSVVRALRHSNSGGTVILRGADGEVRVYDAKSGDFIKNEEC